MRKRRRWGRIAALAALAAALPAPARAAHATLIASLPANGERLEVGPARIRLLFTEPVEAALSEIRLVGAGGTSILLPARVDPADVHALLADVPELAPDAYRVSWRIVSADGHPVRGSFAFFVAEAAALPPPAPADDAAPSSVVWPIGLLRGAAAALLLALAGRLAFMAWLAPEPAGVGTTALAVLAPLLLAAHGLAWVAYASPADLDGSALAAAFRTLPARLEVARLVLAALVLWALVVARRVGLAAALAMLAVLVGAGLGHSAARVPLASIPAKAAHLLAVAIWLGGLLHLATGGTRVARVSTLALSAIAVVAASGVVQTALLLTSPADLVQTPYGLLVLAKTTGLIALALFGARHRYVLIPAVRRGAPAARLAASVRGEAAVMVLVLLVAGLLAYTPIPTG